MEVDNELDQTLLQQFSCMGTTDKDDLVRQLQKLVGHNMNWSTAAFFLDMNNWNLQAAVCSYFDTQSPVFSMVLVRDVTIGEGESVPPDTQFTKTWRVQNNGDEEWPHGCCLQFTGGVQLCESERIYVEPIQPSAVTDISVEMRSPPTPGIYQSKWRMVTPTGSYFGDVIWVILTVAEGGTLALTQQLSHLSDLGASPPPAVPHMLNPFTRLSSSQNVFQDPSDGGDAAMDLRPSGPE
ncbi:hypothetical protein ONE63_009091 [Megalurothrips usitatus]|uniref:Nbr1 FW domain-containing protein n=1 Tax=Megalurothrips usitatus TaxID=439358 RepID=A0AAV7XM00_9NEOP|nr:hypothetical protein ONE63_009091 [Megalurothrips usitatus]